MREEAKDDSKKQANPRTETCAVKNIQQQQEHEINF
jgi:hypothetical protein